MKLFRVRGVVKVAKKCREGRLRWYEHVSTKDKDCMGKGTIQLEVEKRKRKMDRRNGGEIVEKIRRNGICRREY